MAAPRAGPDCWPAGGPDAPKTGRARDDQIFPAQGRAAGAAASPARLKGCFLGAAAARPGLRRANFRRAAASWGLGDVSGRIIGGAASRARLLARGSGRAGRMSPKLDMRAAIRFYRPEAAPRAPRLPAASRRDAAGAAAPGPLRTSVPKKSAKRDSETAWKPNRRDLKKHRKGTFIMINH